MGRPGKPTRSQEILIRQQGYDPTQYLVIAGDPRKMRLLNVFTGEKVRIKKNPAGRNCQGSNK